MEQQRRKEVIFGLPHVTERNLSIAYEQETYEIHPQVLALMGYNIVRWRENGVSEDEILANTKKFIERKKAKLSISPPEIEKLFILGEERDWREYAGLAKITLQMMGGQIIKGNPKPLEE